jgi:predicted RNase H-like HicB family nuclease
MSTLVVQGWTEFPPLDEGEAEVRREFVAILEHGKTGWSAYVPDLPGVVAAGESEGEVRSLIAEAVEFHIEGLREAGEDVPEPTSRAIEVLG